MVGGDEGFHLGEDVKELGGREGVESAGDGVGTGESGWEIDARWEWREIGRGAWDWRSHAWRWDWDAIYGQRWVEV